MTLHVQDVSPITRANARSDQQSNDNEHVYEQPGETGGQYGKCLILQYSYILLLFKAQTRAYFVCYHVIVYVNVIVSVLKIISPPLDPTRRCGNCAYCNYQPHGLIPVQLVNSMTALYSLMILYLYKCIYSFIQVGSIYVSNKLCNNYMYI